MSHPTYEQEQEFILNLGKTLIEWQGIESAAYGLFCTFMQGAKKKLVSVAFHHIQSFQTALSLLDRCAYFALPNEDLRIRWKGEKSKPGERGLHAQLSDQAAVRNRLVHFRYHTGVEDGKPVISLGPSFFDATYAINDRWKNPEFDIDLRRLRQAQRDFERLAKDLSQFRKITYRIFRTFAERGGSSQDS